jgi:cold shock CspA family protein
LDDDLNEGGRDVFVTLSFLLESYTHLSEGEYDCIDIQDDPIGLADFCRG